MSSSPSSTGSPIKLNDRSSNHARSSSLNNDMSLASTTSSVMAAIQNNNNKTIVEEEPELDIDIAKAYCELTEGK